MSGGLGARLLALSLRRRVLAFFAGLALACLAALALGLWLGAARATSIPGAMMTGGLIAGFAILGLITWVWTLFDRHVALATERLARQMRAHTATVTEGTLDLTPSRYLGDLGAAAVGVLERLAETRRELAEVVARETTRLAGEKDRLETLLGDVPVGVVLCSATHDLVFYNGPAVEMLGGETGAGHLPGLARGLFDYLHDGPVREAVARLRATGDDEAATDLLATTVAGGRIIAARMRLVAGEGGAAPGYVLTLNDVTADLAAQAAQNALIDEVFARLRAPAANLHSLIGTALEPGAAPSPAAVAALGGEAARLGSAITELSHRADALRAEYWPLAPIRARDLAAAVEARAEAGADLTLHVEAEDLLLRGDGFQLGALMAALARGLAGSGRDGLGFSITADGAGAMLALDWRGAPLPLATLEDWLDAPLDDSLPDVTARHVLRTHATEIWPEPTAAGARLCLPLREARRATRHATTVTRKVVYDFDLLALERHPEIAAAPLASLTCVVFDTETTGLKPQEGDELVQIAGVRIVNGRRLDGEVFDTLVNPGRRIPPASTAIHGITEAMVTEAPDVPTALRRFHKFAQGAVLIAHNAPFDMTFLKRREKTLGLAFDNPVLDTAILSAMVFGAAESHSLDALSHRLGVTIPVEARHTAIGDTLATADIFLRLLPGLRARGIETFGQLLAEVRRTSSSLRDLNG